ncbi:hypothetical protein GLOTRDRAFT_138639 [Gloeophyllum trabeum ATCC 11539]|uniref:RRM domain-containing protein n=1 Tax=Gloeophyllum trabeum (strain ATCC 11539 / FP-39264 / Madison 617) TaxID=670483 RepID=S7Q8Z0_GLOTA|nr:uncharacterized protein GLOTRDRAFT_138639 [Gloeophyllum trabeum ATCC 11539]EPQ55893.1 hypothetical protein GLOTRDRAFT_138639 [Gloeophyllum trabeum ATCC 11539]
MPRILFVSGFHPSTRARDLAYEFERLLRPPYPMRRSSASKPARPAQPVSVYFVLLLLCLRQASRVEVEPSVKRAAPCNTFFVVPRLSSRKETCYGLPRAQQHHLLVSSPCRFRGRNLPIPRRTEHDRSTPLRIHHSYAFVEFRDSRDAEDAFVDMHARYFEGYRLSVQWAKNPPSSVWRYDRRSPPPRSSRDRRDRSRSPRRGDRDREDRGRDRDRDRRDDRDRDRDREDRDRRRSRSRSPVVEKRRSPTPEPRKEDREDRDDKARTPPPAEDGKKEEDRAQTPPYEH